MKKFKAFLAFVLIASAALFTTKSVFDYLHQNKVLTQMIERLQADSRIAEVLVTGVNYNEKEGLNYTTIKFLEYDSKGEPLDPKYFTFAGNIIQFQALVIRFDDINVRNGDKLKGKSAYLFWKVFMLDGAFTQEYEINAVNEVPKGYEVDGKDPFERQLWKKFWEYALNPERARQGIKNAQIEAPGTMFVPGNLYTIRIEHDGGLRIDTAKLPAILKGEKIPQ